MFWCPKVLRSHVQICSIGTALITISQFFVSEDLWLIDLSALYHYLRWMSFSLIRFFLICWISLVTHVNDGSKAKSQIAFIVVSGNPEILQCLVDNEVSHTLDHPLRSDHFPVVAEFRWSFELTWRMTLMTTLTMRMTLTLTNKRVDDLRCLSKLLVNFISVPICVIFWPHSCAPRNV